MSVLPVPAAAAPCHTCGGAGGARPAPGRAGRRQRVRVPWRLVASTWYRDVALAVYIKVAALAVRAERCKAAVETLARFLGLSKSSVERALTQLINPDPEGLVEVPTVRHTHRGGTGDTAERTVRPMDPRELFVWIPVAAADTLSPRLLRAYTVLAYAQARRLPVTAAELASLLRHHTGARAGQPVDERTARRLITDLEARGWIDVDRRQGRQGRHLITVHDTPLHPVPAATCPDTDDGSGPDTGDGSLAYREDQKTDRPRAAGPADETTVGAPIRRRRGTGTARETPGDNYPVTPPSARPYDGPALTLSPRVAEVLAPVRPLYAAASAYLQRRIAREIGTQLDAYATPDRLRHRLRERYARTALGDIRDPGRWLIGAALPRWGCPDVRCETGVLWQPDGTRPRCHTCRHLGTAHRRRGDEPPLPPAQPAVTA